MSNEDQAKKKKEDDKKGGKGKAKSEVSLRKVKKKDKNKKEEKHDKTAVEKENNSHRKQKPKKRKSQASGKKDHKDNKDNKDNKDSKEPKKKEDKPDDGNNNYQTLAGIPGAVSGATSTVSAAPKEPDVSPEVKKKMEDFINMVGSAGFPNLQTCFTQLKTYTAPEDLYKFTAFQDPKNTPRNKSPDIPCLDHSRLKMEVQVPPKGDYYHANTVKVDGVKRSYVLAQLPFAEDQIDDFWRMVFESNSTTLISLVKTEGGGPNMALQYWPWKDFKNYGIMLVQNKKVVEDPESKLTVTTLEILPDGCSQSLILRLIHVPELWSDNAQPELANIVPLFRLIQATQKGDMGPLMIADNLGVGRAGHMLLLDMYMQVLLTPAATIQMPDMVKKVRDQRACVVQTEFQFIFAIVSILEVVKTVHRVGVDGINKILEDFKKIQLTLSDAAAPPAVSQAGAVTAIPVPLGQGAADAGAAPAAEAQPQAPPAAGAPPPPPAAPTSVQKNKTPPRNNASIYLG